MCTAAQHKVVADAIDAKSHLHAIHMLRALHAGLSVVCRHLPSIIQHNVPGFVPCTVLRW